MRLLIRMKPIPELANQFGENIKVTVAWKTIQEAQSCGKKKKKKKKTTTLDSKQPECLGREFSIIWMRDYPQIVQVIKSSS